MDLDQLTEWLDKNGMFDNSPWLNSFTEKYCSKCESIKCKYADAEEKLGFYLYARCSGEVECVYCELYNRCRFFENLEDVPDNKEMIKMWLEEEAK
jgi:hypothetical protein